MSEMPPHSLDAQTQAAGKRPAGLGRGTIRTCALLTVIAYLAFEIRTSAAPLSSAIRLTAPLAAFIIVFTLLGFLLNAIRQLIAIRLHTKTAFPLLPALRAQLIGQILNKLAPHSGAAYRAVYFKRTVNLPYSQYIGVHASLLWYDLVCIMVAILMCVGCASQASAAGLSLALRCGLMLTVVVLAILPFAAGIIVARVPLAVRRLPSWFANRLTVILGTFSTTSRSSGAALALLGLTAVDVCRTTALYVAAYSGLGVALPLLDALFLCTVTAASTAIQVTPGNLGVRESVFAAIGELRMIGVQEGILASVFLRLVAYALHGLFAVLLIFKPGRRIVR